MSNFTTIDSAIIESISSISIFDRQVNKITSLLSEIQPPAFRQWKILAVEVDNCLIQGEWPPYAKFHRWSGVSANNVLISALKHAQKWGDRLILWTTHEGKTLDSIIEYFDTMHMFIFDAINTNIQYGGNKYSSESRKVYADVYIDSRLLPSSTYLEIDDNINISEHSTEESGDRDDLTDEKPRSPSQHFKKDCLDILNLSEKIQTRLMEETLDSLTSPFTVKKK